MNKIKLFIDHRELKLIDILKGKNELANILSTGNLDIGDIKITNDKYELIIERKTLDDMIASIKDNRYKEQKMRMLSYQNNRQYCKIVYLLEGTELSRYYQKDETTLVGSIISVMLRDNIPIYRSLSIKDSVLFILRLMSRLSKNPSEFFSDKKVIISNLDTKQTNVTNMSNITNKINTTNMMNGGGNDNTSKNNTITINKLNSDGSCNANTNNILTQHPTNSTETKNVNVNIDYLESIKIKKKDNITPDNWFCLALANIPGVSIKIANTIVKEYNNFDKILTKYKLLSTEKEKEQLLSNLKIIEGTRRIGNVLSKRIYNYLVNTKE